MRACPNRLQNQATDSTCTIDGALTVDRRQAPFFAATVVRCGQSNDNALLLLLDCRGLSKAQEDLPLKGFSSIAAPQKGLGARFMAIMGDRAKKLAG